MRSFPVCVAASALLFLLALSKTASGDLTVGAYFEPWIGGLKADYKSIEIRRSFVTSTTPGEGAEFETDLDEVGMRSKYSGGSALFGISTGLRLEAVKLGLHAAWSSPRFDGYWKGYHYSPELGRATGQKVSADGEVGLDRIMFEIVYGLPLWRFEVGFVTRIGSVAFRPGELEVGRSVDDRGLCAEIGARLDFAVIRHVSVGFASTVGGFVFDGAYDGAFGVHRTYSGVLSFHL